MPQIFDCFKKLQIEFDYVYHDVHIGRGLVMAIWQIACKKKVQKLDWHLAFITLNTHQINWLVGTHRVLSTFGQQNRKDHRQVYDYVTEQLNENVSLNDMNAWGVKRCFHPLLLIKVFFWIITKFQQDVSFKDKCMVFLQTMYMCNTLADLEKQKFDGLEKYLCMYNANHIENLFTQYFRLKGVKTYSLSEGLYMVYDRNVPVDAINYENISTENLIVWSQWVKDSFVEYGVNPKQIAVGGYPHHLPYVKIKQSNHLKKCVVLLSRQLLHESNMQLLDMLSSFTNEIHFEIKLHPSLDFIAYKSYAQNHNMIVISPSVTIEECLSNDVYDFAIAGQTTVYYEVMTKGIPCLRFDDGKSTLMAGYDDVFTSRETFVTRIEELRNMDITVYQQHVNDMLEYCLGYGVNNYKHIIEN